MINVVVVVMEPLILRTNLTMLLCTRIAALEIFLIHALSIQRVLQDVIQVLGRVPLLPEPIISVEEIVMDKILLQM
jgi:hypothetical protein